MPIFIKKTSHGTRYKSVLHIPIYDILPKSTQASIKQWLKSIKITFLKISQLHCAFRCYHIFYLSNQCTI